MESILTSIKKLLGVGEDYNHFDADIIMHINAAFMVLNQLGVGPSDGFSIVDATAVWTEFIPEDDKNFGAVQSYVYLKVKLLFDPPLTSAVIESMKNMIDEYEWRLNVAAESTDSE
jgi:hypothetical protein